MPRRKLRAVRSVTATALLAAFLCPSIRAAAAVQETGASLLAKVDRIRNPPGSFAMDVTITTHDSTGRTQVSGYEVYVGGENRTLVRFTAPKGERGKCLLMVDDELWIYLPAVGKAIRIPLAQRLAGNAANGDIARLSFGADYDATLIGTESVLGSESDVLELTARRSGATYGKIRLWVAKETSHPLKAEFTALSGQLLKTGLYESYATVLGRLRPTRLVLTDQIRQDLVSTLEYTNVRKKEMPAKFFNKNYLKDLE
jgi:outer membrane lipoprotein-sorting protein